MSYRVNCLVCGAELRYQDKPAGVICHFCKEEHESSVQCIKGHFVCDRCHSLPANEAINRFCIDSTLEDPVELAVTLMRHPGVAMHGPEHHFLVPAVLLSSLYNVKEDSVAKEEKIRAAEKRASNVPGGFCGYYGACGAAVGTGIFISLFTGANPLSKDEWRLSNLCTAKSLYSVADAGGPRCCKRTTFLSITQASDFLREHFGISLPVTRDIKCEFSSLNKECIKEDCPFHCGIRG